jgi:hypothetical protein
MSESNNNNNILPPSKPITINQSKSQDNGSLSRLSSWSPVTGSMFTGNNYGMFTTSPPLNLPPISPVSPPSSLSSFISQSDVNNTVQPLRRRMSLNIGANSISPTFFRPIKTDMDSSNSGLGDSNSRRPLRRYRTYSSSEADTVKLAEKWGFVVRPKDDDSASSSYGSSFSRSSFASDFSPDSIAERRSENPSRPKSPMRDMILEGQFLD